jgi:hypothetical protein
MDAMPPKTIAAAIIIHPFFILAPFDDMDAPIEPEKGQLLMLNFNFFKQTNLSPPSLASAKGVSKN